jgi:UDP-3-O-[3-hydroxymyristoyl] N-acetylglucosamine deacetylase
VSANPVHQRTLKTAISCTGVGLHSGVRVTMTLHPAPANSGIVFKRTDIAGRAALIPASWRHVVDTRLCTTIGVEGGAKIGTIEHLMAALFACQIDNVVIELNGPEVPVMDGSSAPFIFLIECAGVLSQDAPRRAIEVLERVTIDDGERLLSIAPSAGFSVEIDIDFESQVIARQECAMALDPDSFKTEISRARTFGFEHEISHLRANGLARGGSLDNAVVIGADRILNEGGLRYEDEFVRHKVLDCVGDLYLAGAPILGHIRGSRPGHKMNNQLLHALFERPSAWRSVTLTDQHLAAAARRAATPPALHLAAGD